MPGQRYCLSCKAAWKREHFANNPVARAKDNARAYAGVYKSRGLLIPKPCEHPGCGSTDVQMHHDDYSRPLDVHWLCREHHLLHHQVSAAAQGAALPA